MLTFDGYYNIYYCDVRVGNVTCILELSPPMWLGTANVFDQWIECRAHSAEDLLMYMNRKLRKQRAHTATGDVSWLQH